MRRVLLIDRSPADAVALKAALRRHGFEAKVEDLQWRAVQVLRRPVLECEFVVIVARSTPESDVKQLRELVMASQQFHQSGQPEFLYASCVRCVPSLRVQIGRLGARYVRL
jgi:hypothetical protein